MRIKSMATMAALTLVLTAAPAFADHEPSLESSGDSRLVMLLSDEFGLTEEQVEGWRELGLGFGVIFKLQTLAIALGTDIDTLLAGAEIDPETGEYAFDFGELRRSLTDEQLALLETLPKNFGAIVSAFNKAKHGDEHGQPEWAGSGKPEWAGDGKPPFAGDDEEEEDEGA